MNRNVLRKYLIDHPKVLSIWFFITTVFSNTKWPRIQSFLNGGIYYKLAEEDQDIIRRLLKDNYLVALTRRECHLTTFIISFGSWLVTKKSAHYAHACMNVEGDIQNNVDFKLIEATMVGVHYSTFLEVFDCDSVALLKPKGISLEKWTLVMDSVKADFGKKYDELFDITNEEKVSCVELIYNGIMKLPNYQEDFKELLDLIETTKDLTPQMLYDCNDLDVVFEVRR